MTQGKAKPKQKEQQKSHQNTEVIKNGDCLLRKRKGLPSMSYKMTRTQNHWARLSGPFTSTCVAPASPMFVPLGAGWGAFVVVVVACSPGGEAFLVLSAFRLPFLPLDTPPLPLALLLSALPSHSEPAPAPNRTSPRTWAFFHGLPEATVRV